MPILDPVTPLLKLHAFTGYGIELEYMIVDRDTLAVRPMVDTLLLDDAGQVGNEFEHGPLAWSNELVLHVIELKTNGPAKSLGHLAELFHADVLEINRSLAPRGAQLLPTAMHPLFQPDRETRLWPHGQNEIYSAYDRIFGCQGHGWSNLQSMHINLPFFDDEEFRRLHAAIRVVLPLIPALSASSVFQDGKRAAWFDNRLRYYRDNQKSIPEISGLVIPEAVTGIEDYHATILVPMYRAIAGHDPDEILADDWLNSRAAIARFERQTIEIRVIDLQECPAADLAIAEVVVALVKAFYDEQLADFKSQQALATADLARIFWQVSEHGSQALIDQADYLALLGLDTGGPAGQVWQRLLAGGLEVSPAAARLLGQIIARGSLAEAIVARTGPEPTAETIVDCYRELGTCLVENRLFLP
jgi:carboxylate-amine ligase